MIQGYDPRTGEPAGEPVPETTDAEVDAIALAAAAASIPWEAAGPAGRAAALDAVAAALDGSAAELVAAADTETALGTARLTGEVARATGQLRHFAAVLADGGYADAVVSPGGDGVPGLRRVNRPIGPVAVFAASNFPFAFSVAGNDTASALAAGCPVVVKAHEAHPQTSALTARIVTEALAGAGAPPGGGAGGPMLTARIHDAFTAAVAELGARPDVAELAEGQPGEGPWSATPAVYQIGLAEFAAGLPGLAQERFGPVGLV